MTFLPTEDAKVLNEMGVSGNYGPGTPPDLIVEHVKKLVKKATI
jgi:methylmalonyl-CoA mutase cobalamin-binding subunit